MDSQDSSAPPPHHHHHHHHPQPPFSSHHAILMSQQNPIQEHPSNNYPPLLNRNNSVAPTTSAAHQQNSLFSFTSGAAQKPMAPYYADGSPPGSGGAWFNVEPIKKRGRPRKYSPDNSIGLGLSPAPTTQVPSASPVGNVDSPSSETPKRHRGRPPGSVKKQMDALGVPGVGFTPHVITVNSGEDIASTIMAFSQQGPRRVCILSATGAISNVTLRQPATPGGTVTYEGRFEIISLSGSLSESDDSQIGGLTVSMAGADSRVLGGEVAGMLRAASPVQVVVGSFIAEVKKPKGGGPPPSNTLNFGTPAVTQTSPPSPDASSDEEDDDDGSHLGPGSGELYAAAGRGEQSVPAYWQNSTKMHPR
ncbi:hypothetical protein ACS0TY_011092 [Phlomoides rotata]